MRSRFDFRTVLVVALLGVNLPCVAQTQPASSGIATLLNFDGRSSEDAVQRFYQARQFAPAWTGSADANANARAALDVLSRAADEGLDPARYNVALAQSATSSQRDVAITGAVLGYMDDMEAGRSDLKNLDADVALPHPSFNAPGVLTDALREGQLANMLAALAPPNREYTVLKSALSRYRALAAKGGWPLLPAATPAEFAGSLAPLLQRRLSYEAPGTPSGTDLASAVRDFQRSHGLVPDGTVGPRTRDALNVSAAARADTIAANMERWRWLPRTLEPDRIIINVPDAQLQMWLNGKPVLTSRVVVGRPGDPTPILRAEGAGVTINPPWTVPTSIAAREILPKLQRNHAYLASQDMVLIDGPPGDPQGLHINWRAVRAGTFPYRIRQYPGPRNPLGRIKLELPNRFDVYLHDTPVKSAFVLPVRDLSHGCVRVEQILPLASYALGADPSAVDFIARSIDAGATKYLPLKKKLPVYFLYWTAFVDANDDVVFRQDIYGRDQRLIAASKTGVARSADLSSGCRKA